MATAPPPGFSAAAPPQPGVQYTAPGAAVAESAPASSGVPGRPPPPGDASSNLLQDIARDVGQQVEMMILKAKHASETKVSQEIQKIKVKMDALCEKIALVHKKLGKLDVTAEPILKADLQGSIDKLEEVWEGEVGNLKHELWQTIQAHNHNADLMKHHKEAIDQVQARMAETSSGGPETVQIQELLAQVDRVMHREQAKQQQIDQFMQRLANVQQHIGGVGWGGGLAAPMAAPQAMGVPMQAVGGKKVHAQTAAKKQAKAKGNAAAKPSAPVAQAALLPSMRAEAPEFVPTVAPLDGG